MSEKQALCSPEAPPPSYQQVTGYHGYGAGTGVPSHVNKGQPGFNTNYNTDYGTGQQTVMMQQPVSFSGSLNPVPDHMGLAIFSTVLCCWPIGIFAILKAQEARRATDRGDISTAMTLSAQAKRYCLMAVICGGVFLIAVVVGVTIIIENGNDDY